MKFIRRSLLVFGLLTFVSLINANSVSAQSYNVSGSVNDAFGNPVANQQIIFDANNGTMFDTITDVNGNFSLSVDQGTYIFRVIRSINPLTINIPQYNRIDVSSFVVNQNISNLNLTLPTKSVTIQVQYPNGQPVSNAEINVLNGKTDSNLDIGGGISNAGGTSWYGYNTTGPITDQNGYVNLQLYPNQDGIPYTFVAKPPSGSTYVITKVNNKIITNDTTETIILQEPVTLSGYIHDFQDVPLANQQIYVVSADGVRTDAFTDNSGNYLLSVAPDTYVVNVIKSNNPFTVNAPQYNQLILNNFSLTTNKQLNITLPTKTVTVEVKDSFGTPIPNIEVKALNGQNSNLTISEAVSNVLGRSWYGFTQPGPKTDEFGKVTLRLYTNDIDTTYRIIANPDQGSIYSEKILDNVSITGDQTVNLSLNYSHVAPITTSTLSTTPNAQGNYPNPTSVALQATASATYTIQNTYFKLDGGTQQVYTSPVIVSGESQHTIEFWSVDNSGVIENHKTRTFTIKNNVAPSINAINNATVNVGTYTVNGSFTDPDSSSWTATVNYGDGSGVQPLTLTGTSFTLNHSYNNVGNYTVTVTVTDNQGLTSTSTATITVQRQLVTLNPAQVWIGLGANKDSGIRFDIQTQVYANGVLVSTGQLNSVSGGTSTQFSGAILSSVPFASFSPTNFPSTSTLNIKVLVRNACSGSTKASGNAKLWYNSATANSSFGAKIGLNTNTHYLRNNFGLSTTPGTSVLSSSVAVGAQCGPYVQLGSWSTTL